MYSDDGDPRDAPGRPYADDDVFVRRLARIEEEEALETDRDWLRLLTGILGEGQ